MSLLISINISNNNPYLKLFYEIRIKLIRICVSIVVILAICMTLSVTMIEFYEYKLPILYPDIYNNISIQVITLLSNDLLPKNVDLIQTVPSQAFYAQIYVAIVIGLIAGLPVIFKEFFTFIGPALYTEEKIIIKKTIIPAIFLFGIGCCFAYFVVIPYSLEFLYAYGQSIGVIPFFEITQFIIFVVNLLVILGLSYQIPLLMWGITKTKLIKPDFWKNNLRYVIIFMVILGALLTPDASGITMWFIAGPLIFLYILGLFFINLKRPLFHKK